MSYRFLVVDDTHFMRKMAADCLKQHGHTVAGEAVNGKEAIRMYAELRPDIVTMDLTMPEMNGIEALKEILKIDPGAVVLICSASNQQDLIFQALDIGAKGYLMKPFNPERLEEVIRKYAEPHLTAAAPPHADEAAVAAETVEPVDADEEMCAAAIPVEDVGEVEAVVEEASVQAPVAVSAADAPAPEAEPEAVEESIAAIPISRTMRPWRGGDKVRSFTSSIMCNWQEEMGGETTRYAAVCTESENRIVIEMTNADSNEKHQLPFSLDGFRQLAHWLETQTGGRTT